MEQFGVWVIEASTDIDPCLGFAPDKVLYQKSARTLVSGPGFMSPYPGPDTNSYLTQLRSVSDGILNRKESQITDLQTHASKPTLMSDVNPVSLDSVVGAIRRSEAMEVRYQAPSNPLPRSCELAPQATVTVLQPKEG